jgi:hypothetical protein
LIFCREVPEAGNEMGGGIPGASLKLTSKENEICDTQTVEI